jgi:2-keto-4-pentenoate hydratase/2-oxohepta-3-ene-1,7-dioic acid hydratase in catechol pathway
VRAEILFVGDGRVKSLSGTVLKSRLIRVQHDQESDRWRYFMKIIRFVDTSGQERYGEAIDQKNARIISGDLFGAYRLTDETAAVQQLLAPVLPPSILCVGLNYKEHAAESAMKLPDYPVLFIKSLNALNNPGDPIVLPKIEPVEVDYEGELVVVIGKGGKNISRAQALKHVLGYTCGNDVSGRDWQIKKGGSQWCRGKSFDTFCPLGPWLVTPDELPDPGNLKISTTINGEVMQSSSTANMIFDVPELIRFLSEGTTLLPGTVIMTGTPPGVGFARNPPVFLKDGDEVSVEIEKIGRLTNPVRRERD